MRLIARQLRYRHSPELPYVLSGVDLDIADAELVAIAGPSGSGKTTLLALLGGLLRVQSGRVWMVDKKGGMYEPANHVAWVLQSVNVLRDRSVLDNVCLGAFSRGLNRVEGAADARRWLAAVGLEDRRDDPVRMLSGGEVQRVAIAQALTSRRPVLLADEPTGQLDAATTDAVLSALFDRAHGRTVVVVTHDPEVARRCDRVLRMRDGVLYSDVEPL